MNMTDRRADATRTRWLDGGAVLLSVLCLGHCLALPLIVVAAPELAGLFPDQPWVHPVILAVAAPLAMAALWRGWSQHGDRRPAALGGVGVILLAGGTVAGDNPVGTVVTVLGGLTLAAAHLRNWRAGHRDHNWAVDAGLPARDASD